MLFSPRRHFADNLLQDGMLCGHFDLAGKIQCSSLLSRLRPNVYQLIKGCLCLRNGVGPLPAEQTLLHLILAMWIIVATQKGPKNTPGQSVPTPRRAPINGCSSMAESTAASQVSLAGWRIASVSFWRMMSSCSRLVARYATRAAAVFLCDESSRCVFEHIRSFC